MRGPPLTAPQLRNAISALAALLPQDKPAEMILIGGGAGMLSELLPDSRLTVDLDVMDVTPPEIFDLCCYHAPRIAEECDISPRWFDATPHTIRHMMLPGWRDRTTPVGEFGPLRVRAIARIDLISLKAIASRQRDIDDLLSLRVTRDEARFVHDSLPKLLEKGANPDHIDTALRTIRMIGGLDEPR